MKRISIILFVFYLITGLSLTVVTGYYGIGTAIIESFKNFNSSSLFDSTEGLFGAVERSMQNEFWQDDKYIDIYGGIQRITGRQIVIGSGDTTVIRSKSGNLYFGNTTSKIDCEYPEQTKAIERVVGFNDYCESMGVDFVYVVAPNKSAYIKKENLPAIAGMTDYQKFAEDMSKKLSDRGVKVLDLMSTLKEKSKNYESEFFLTDHHWRIETAFWGFGQICNFLNNNTDCSIEKRYYDINEYDINIVKHAMMGSMGVRVGNLYHKKDDYALIIPRYKTDFSASLSDGFLNKSEIIQKGDFKTAFLNNTDKGITYGSYISGDRDRIFIDNRLNDSGPNILVIKDSFAIPVSAWMACVSDELWIVDLRYKQEESMYDFVKKNNIDTVIVMYNPEMFGSVDTAFCFEKISIGN